MMRNRFLALIDVLGFRKGVTSHKSEEFIQTYLKAVKDVITPSMEALSNQLEYVVFSDSILITSKMPLTAELSEDVAEKDRFNAILFCCSRLLYSLTIKEIPIRGSISYGPLERTSIGDDKNNGGNVFIAGPALIEAYDIERRQNWIGITLCPSVYKKMNAVLNKWDFFTFIKEEQYDKLFLTDTYKWHEIPFNSGNGTPDLIDGYIIYPKTINKDNKNDLNEFIDALNVMRMSNFETSIRIKYQNSIDIFNKINNKVRGATQSMKIEYL